MINSDLVRIAHRHHPGRHQHSMRQQQPLWLPMLSNLMPADVTQYRVLMWVSMVVVFADRDLLDHLDL